MKKIDCRYAIYTITETGEVEFYRTHQSKAKPEGTVSLYNTVQAAMNTLEYIKEYKPGFSKAEVTQVGVYVETLKCLRS